ncbi:MAG: hypothetical protein AAGM16_11375 [Pseudomonadota bacterium]
MSARFLEISVTSHDLPASLNFYRSLGFTELTTADTWPHPYAVVTDGQVTIGLHGHAFEAPRIALSLPDLQRTALQLGDNPRLQSMRIDPESFHEVLLADEDHHALWLLEARTYSPASETPPRSQLGSVLEWTLPVRDALASAQFWAPYSNASLAVIERPSMHMRLAIDSLPVGLSEQARGRDPMLSWRVDDLATLGVTLNRIGHPLQRCGIGIDGCYGLVTTPEGLGFSVFGVDFAD